MHIIRRFTEGRKGAVGAVFAIALLPLVGCMGAAVDYARATSARATIQSALDSAALAMAKEAPKDSEAALITKANYYFAALMLKESDILHGGVSLKKTDKSVELAVEGFVKTSFAGVFGMPQWTIGVKAVRGS